jgi:PHD/YefM family antitoxin component YafN of YafNO toxin-antitoxin module
MKTVVTPTAARANLYSLIDQANTSHQPIYIHSKRKGAILVAEEDWRAIEETLYLLSIPNMRESIRKGLETPLDQCFEELNW